MRQVAEVAQVDRLRPGVATVLARGDPDVLGCPFRPARFDENTTSRPSSRTFGWMSFAAGSLNSASSSVLLDQLWVR
jgi:hypothetical protein